MNNMLSMLGLAKKAGRVEIGEEPVGAAARARDARLILLASDAADNTLRRARHFAEAGACLLTQIPATKDEVRFSSEADRDAFWAFVEQDSYLSKHKGQYAEAYAARAPFVHRFDLRLAKDIKFRIGSTSHKFQLSASIDNIGNMFNSKWGVRQFAYNQSGTSYPSANSITPLKLESVDASGVPTFSFNKVDGNYPTKTYTNYFKNTAECWQVLLGLKYYFN